MFEHSLKPGRIGSLELKNRFVMPAMASSHGEGGGKVGQQLIDYYAARARGGFGLLISEFACVDPPGKAIPTQLMIDTDEAIEGFSRLADAVHRAGSKVLIQIQHSGRQTSSMVSGFEPVAPSAVACPVFGQVPRELTIDEIYALIEKFGDAALRVQAAGCDGVEIHGAHGYLVAQFMSGYSNKRSDEFGGGIGDRSRFAVELIRNIKKKCGADFPVVMRISADERVAGGRNAHEGAAIARLLEAAGADAIDVSTGVYASMPWMVAPANVPVGFNLADTVPIKHAVGVPVIAVGRINDPYLAEQVLAGGIADFVAIGRGSIADAEFPNKVARGAPEEISPCVGCMTRCQGVPGIMPDDHGVSCMINPLSGHEGTLKITPAQTRKRVVIVGGGPGGLEAAWIAAARGHDVTLLEKGERCGGQFIAAAVPPFKQELSRAIAYYIRMCEKYGVDIRTGVDASAQTVLACEPDVVILATGGVPLECPMPTGGIPVVDAVDVLLGKASPGMRSLIVGGGMVGLETAEHLVSQNRRATVVEMRGEVGADMHPSTRYFTLRSLREAGVEILTDTKVEKLTDHGAACVNIAGAVDLSGYDTVVLAIGAQADNPLEEALRDRVEQLYVIGDAKAPRRAVEAIEEGARLALEI